jgi:spoIIIJ-associated protein
MGRSVPLSIDVEGYRSRRQQQLKQLARRIADQVVETNRSQALEPMPANERRLIHIELRSHPDVYTESAGEGDRRKIVIYPKN